MIIDGLVARFTGNAKVYDDGGEIALSGKVQDDLLARMMEHPFLEQPIPKSTGRESFGSDYIDWVIEAGRDRDWRNLVATAAAFTAESVIKAIRKYLEPIHPIDKLIISGGGARNRAIVKVLEEDLPGVTVMTSDKLGIPVDAKEAIGFAVLAAESVRGVPSNVPSATGAGKSAVLGNITIPSVSSR
jgi:anhydro-N-acetylmuramic acid kinase